MRFDMLAMILYIDNHAEQSLATIEQEKPQRYILYMQSKMLLFEIAETIGFLQPNLMYKTCWVKYCGGSITN